MKTLTLILTSFITVSSFASQLPLTPKSIAKCYGDHHGNYVNILMDQANHVSIELSTDSDESPTRRYAAKTVKRLFGGLLNPSDRKSVIQTAISNPDFLSGPIVIKAAGKSGRILINLAAASGQYLVSGDYVEALTCEIK